MSIHYIKPNTIKVTQLPCPITIKGVDAFVIHFNGNFFSITSGDYPLSMLDKSFSEILDAIQKELIIYMIDDNGTYVQYNFNGDGTVVAFAGTAFEIYEDNDQTYIYLINITLFVNSDNIYFNRADGYINDYELLNNKPYIPENVSDLNNDLNFVESSDLASVATSGDYNDLQNTPNLAAVATSGSYNDLNDKPTIVGQVQSDWNQSNSNEVDFIKNKPTLGTMAAENASDYTPTASLASVATSGDYNDLQNTPAIPTVPTDLSAFNNDVGYITGIDSNDVTNALGYTPGTSNFSGSYTDLSDKPTIPDDLADLNDDSTHRLVTDTEKSTWDGKSDFSGSYNDLTDKPTIPTAGIPGGGNAGQILKKVSATDYDVTWANQSETLPSAYCTTAGSTAAKKANCSLYVTQANQYLQVLIGSANTYQGALTLNINSAGAKPIYINGTASSSSNYTLPNGTYFVFYDGTNYYFRTDGKLTMPNAAFSGSYTELANKPTIPANTSDLNNDSGFIDSSVNNLTNYSLTTDIQNNKNLAKGIEYIVGTQASDTNAWLGVSTDTGCSNGNLYIGKTIIYHLPVAGTSSAATLELTLPDASTTGAKNIYRQASTTVTTTYAAGCDILMVWNGSSWKIAAYVDTNTNTIGYQLRTNSTVFINKTGYSSNRYTLLFEVEGGLSGASTTIGTGTSKTAVAFKYIPGGRIKYYSTSGTIANDGEFASGGLWDQYTCNLGYTFNTGSTLTAKKPVYMRCTINNDGTLTPYNSGTPSHPIVQDLPTTADGYAYVYLGEAYSTTSMELYLTHPIYEFKNGRIRQFQYDPASSSTDVRINGTSITSSNIADIKTESAYNETSNKIATMSDLPSVPTNISAFNNDSGYLISESDPTVPSWAKASSKPSYNFSEIGTTPTTLSGYGITDAKIVSGTITLGSETITPITSETQLSKGTTTGSGNAVTDISVSNHQITLTKGKTFLESYTETDPVFSASDAASITSSDISNWNGKEDPVNRVDSSTGITSNGTDAEYPTVKAVYDYVPQILSGANDPSNGDGRDGDIYLKLI